MKNCVSWLWLAVSAFVLSGCPTSATSDGGFTPSDAGDASVGPFVPSGPYSVTGRFVVIGKRPPRVTARVSSGTLVERTDGGEWGWDVNGGVLEVELSEPGHATRLIKVRATVDLGLLQPLHGIDLGEQLQASELGRGGLLVASAGRPEPVPTDALVIYSPASGVDAGTWLFEKTDAGALRATRISDGRWRAVRTTDALNGALLVEVPDPGKAPRLGWWDSATRKVAFAGVLEPIAQVLTSDEASSLAASVSWPITAVNGPTHRFAFRSTPFLVGELGPSGLRVLRAVPQSEGVAANEPKFSPDGRFVSVVMTSAGGASTLVIHDLMGTGRSTLTLPGCATGSGSWLRDGSGLLSLEGTARGCTGLSLVSLDGGAALLEPTAIAAWPLADGRIALQRPNGNSLAILPLDGGSELAVASGELKSTLVLRGTDLLFSTADRSAVLSLESGSVTEVTLPPADHPYRQWAPLTGWAARAALPNDSRLPAVVWDSIDHASSSAFTAPATDGGFAFLGQFAGTPSPARVSVPQVTPWSEPYQLPCVPFEVTGASPVSGSEGSCLVTY